MARRAGACANPIAPEKRAHDELAESAQLPPRPDLELNMKSSLEFEHGGFEPRQRRLERAPGPAGGVRPTRARPHTLLRWLEGPWPRARLPLEPEPLPSHTSHWLSPMALTLGLKPQTNPMIQP